MRDCGREGETGGASSGVSFPSSLLTPSPSGQSQVAAVAAAAAVSSSLYFTRNHMHDREMQKDPDQRVISCCTPNSQNCTSASTSAAAGREGATSSTPSSSAKPSVGSQIPPLSPSPLTPSHPLLASLHRGEQLLMRMMMMMR